MLLDYFLQYLHKVTSSTMSQREVLAKRTKENVRHFSSFVQEMEFFAAQTGLCWRMRLPLLARSTDRMRARQEHPA
jgi:hypothetical protein